MSTEEYKNKVITEDSQTFVKKLEDNSIDLIITSPPYGQNSESGEGLRKYNGFAWSFDLLVPELYRILKPGGVMCWNEGEQTVNGCETLIPFKHAISFVEKYGFKLDDTIIFQKRRYLPLNCRRYDHVFEYVFVLVKGKLQTFNPLMKDKACVDNRETKVMHRTSDGGHKIGKLNKNTKTKRTNVWEYLAGSNTSSDKIAYKHPAIMCEDLCKDLILSYSNIGDIIYDPFAGACTTPKCAILTERNFIASEISPEYTEIGLQRILPILRNMQIRNGEF